MALAALFAISLASRLLMLGITGPVLSPDSYHYLSIARNLIDQGSLSEKDQITGDLRPQTLRTPGYPLYAALFYALFEVPETAHTAIAISQVILASLLPSLVACFGIKYFSLRVGLLAGVLSALDPWLSYGSLLLLADVPFSLLYFLYFVLGATTLRKPRTSTTILWAFLLGAATLVKPIAESQILILLALLLVLRISPRRRLGLAAIAVVMFGLLVGCWRLRNRLETGYWDLVTHKGRSLLWETAHFTSPSTPEQYEQEPQLAQARDIIAATPRRVAEIVSRAPNRKRPHEGQVAFMRLREEMALSEQEADHLMATIAWENIRGHPLAYLARSVKESVLFLTRISMPVDLVWDLGVVETGVVDSLRRRQYLYPLMNLAFRAATAIAFLPLMFCGLGKAWRALPEHRLLHLFFTLTLMYHFVIVGLVVGDDRYRLPLHGMMWLYVAYGTCTLGLGRWFARRSPGDGAGSAAE